MRQFLEFIRALLGRRFDTAIAWEDGEPAEDRRAGR